ncbi:hypothetical protein HPB52_011100 [Rhipicephalus sanguineus]|uniref:Regulatory protein zeste n=1 Tax=Rhipicephalus sanguineus TaxID=34632 RepID=A0A9D4PI96_RHISA|nr:hypothetical protein HPB52_011100 [Rhipicephalus sanguineus]
MEKKKINFSEEERAVLLDLLSRHRSVVENKRTDAASASRKRDSWKKIEDEFNSRHNLKKCWENMKDKWRRTNAEDMRERFATGGGTPPSSEMSDELQETSLHPCLFVCPATAAGMPGGSQSSNQLCTPSVAALLSQTQDTALEESAGFGAATLYWLM